MTTLLLHISDIHIDNESDPVLSRADQIVAAVQSLTPRPDLCIVAVTGDIAFSGKEEQYLLAGAFLGDLSVGLSHSLGITDEKIVLAVVPGNHDCDFQSNEGIRDVARQAALASPMNRQDISVVRTVTGPQTNFFLFRNAYAPPREDPDNQDIQQLYYTYNIPVGDRHIRMHAINTAWLSQLNEEQGRLLLPEWLLPESGDANTFDVALFHHGYVWLESTNARMARYKLESLCDLVLTGHDHVGDRRQVIDKTGKQLGYVEGAVLQERDSPDDSGFHAWLLELDQLRCKSFSFHWRNGKYEIDEALSGAIDPVDIEWKDLTVGGRRSDRWPLAENFQRNLEDLGIPLRHPETELTLADIFVWPDLITPKALTGEEVRERHASADVPRILRQPGLFVVTGPTQSGKTATSKMLFQQCYDEGDIPVLLDGDSDVPVVGHALRKVHDTFRAQYPNTPLTDYQQLPRERRVVLIDNFDRLRHQPRERTRIIEEISEYARTVVAFANDLSLSVDELLDPGVTIQANVTQFEISEFGHERRGELVERWLALSPTRDQTTAYIQRFDELTRLVDDLLGKNVVPAFPIYMLSVLQAVEASTTIEVRPVHTGTSMSSSSALTSLGDVIERSLISTSPTSPILPITCSRRTRGRSLKTNCVPHTTISLIQMSCASHSST